MTRTINNGRVTQVLMRHPIRGYKWLDQKTEPQHNMNKWSLVDKDEAEAWMKAEEARESGKQNGATTISGKPVEIIAQRGDVLDPKQAEIDRLHAELAALKASKIEVPFASTSTADPLPKKPRGRPRKQPA